MRAERVVSLNLCTDQMLVLLAPEKIAALSPLARDPALSFVAPQAAHLPVVRASAEAVLRLHPDLILAAPYGAQTTLALLQQEGIPVLRIALPQDFAGIRRMTRTLAAHARRAGAGRGAARRDGCQARRAAASGRMRCAPWSGSRAASPRAGHADGRGAARRRPDQRLGRPAAWAWRRCCATRPICWSSRPRRPIRRSPPTLLDHPALAGLPRRAIPPALTICAGPFTAEAAALLAR